LCPQVSPHLHAHLQHLPSFPTRRSSDLAHAAARSSARRVMVRTRSRRYSASDWVSSIGSTASAATSAAERNVAIEDTQSDAENRDRKSTRLNSSHVAISYAVFCLKKKQN